jgi:Sporulation and spore germination
MRLRPAAAVVSLGLVAALATAGCGIRPDHGAVLAQPADVPFDLLDPSPPVTVTTAGSVSSTPTAKATIFLVQGERLAAATRDLPAPVSAPSILEALTAGPTDSEIALGLRTALLADNLIHSVNVAGGIATVDLGPAFTEIGGRDQIVALAQIVSTLTGLPGVGRVSFTLGGSPVGVPRGDGAITTESVSRDDYALLAPVPVG